MEADLAFEELKLAMIKTPVLAFSDFSKMFMVKTDTYRVGEWVQSWHKMDTQ